MDSTTTVSELKDEIRRFCERRDWDQFHSPKDLAIGVLTESAELLEHFRFMSESDQEALLADPRKREQIEREVADITIFLLRFVERYEIDLATAFRTKMKINEGRYPVDKARGTNRRSADL